MSRVVITLSTIMCGKPLRPAPHHEGIQRSRGIAPLLIYFSTRWRRVVKFTIRPLYTREKHSIRTEQEAGKGVSAGRDILEKRKFRTANRPASNPVAIPTTLLYYYYYNSFHTSSMFLRNNISLALLASSCNLCFSCTICWYSLLPNRTTLYHSLQPLHLTQLHINSVCVCVCV